MSLFYGKYRGTVTDNQDPYRIGRIRARVPNVTGDLETGWALPCFPFAGVAMGFFALPKMGAWVWIEFEGGKLDYPIWSGCFYGADADSTGDVPSLLQSPPYKKVLLKTEGGQSITLDDSSGVNGIILETSGGQKIKLSADGIEIDTGQGGTIKLSGSQVNVNNGALEVM